MLTEEQFADYLRGVDKAIQSAPMQAKETGKTAFVRDDYGFVQRLPVVESVTFALPDFGEFEIRNEWGVLIAFLDELKRNRRAFTCPVPRKKKVGVPRYVKKYRKLVGV